MGSSETNTEATFGRPKMGGEGKQMHAVVLAMPVAGQINPMLQASLKLASMGVKVTFVNSHSFKHMKLPTSSPAPSSSSTMEADAEHPIPSIPNISFLYIPDGLPPECSFSPEMITTLDACYGPAFELLMQSLVVQDPPVTCIICNTLISHVQDAAKRLHLPFVSFWTQSAASYASLLLVSKGKVPPKDALLSSAVASDLLPPGIPHIKYKDFEALLLALEPDSFGFKLLTSSFKTIAEADGILMNTFEELEPETMAFLQREGHPVFTVGPLLPYSFFDVERASEDGMEWVADEEGGKTWSLLRWLDKQEAGSVIYVSFGSLAMMNAEQIQELAVGLEESKQAFLWVLRQNGKKPMEEQLPEGFFERTSEQGLVIPWAPQIRVLQHKAVGGFLTHCGWNSTLESISAGVPLLGWPLLSDQGLNCRSIVEKWHVGLSLEKAEESTGLVRRTEIQKKVVELLHGDVGQVVQANVKKWRATAMRAASHTDGSSVSNLRRFVDQLGQL